MMKKSFSFLFIILITFYGLGQTKIVGYQYAFNDGVNLTYVPITPTTDFHLQTDIDVSSLTHTINQIHIRFVDENGLWSGIVNQMFIKNIQTGGTQDLKIVGYEYYFNNDTTNRHYTAVNSQDDYNLVTDIDVNQLPHTINQIHFRFKDSSGQWSSVINQMFIHNPASEAIVDNKIISYEYWVDDDMNSMKNISVQPNVVDLNVLDLDLNHVWRGQHVLHSRYLDRNGTYSLVTTDTIMKASHPLARFTTSTTEICEGESIQFDDDNSVDYDTHVWDFGDGTSATGLHETHTYTGAGTYTVTLTVTDTNTNVSNAMQANITVNAPPDNALSITGNNPACYGDTVTLSANASGMNYLWNTGDTTQSIDVTTAGTYSVIITNPQTGCQSTSADMNVDFYPEINNQVSVQNNPVELIADQDNATYQWLDCNNGQTPIAGETNQNFIPNQSGNYAVAISMNNCQVISNCYAVTVVGIAGNSLDGKFKIYPNPASDKIQVKLLENNDIDISIININGQHIGSYKFNKPINVINVSNYKPGIYILKIRFLSGKYQNKQSYLKFIKK